MRRCPQLLALLAPVHPQFLSQMGPWRKQGASHLPLAPKTCVFSHYTSQGLKDIILTLNTGLHTSIQGTAMEQGEHVPEKPRSLRSVLRQLKTDTHTPCSLVCPRKRKAVTGQAKRSCQYQQIRREQLPLFP